MKSLPKVIPSQFASISIASGFALAIAGAAIVPTVSYAQGLITFSLYSQNATPASTSNVAFGTGTAGTPIPSGPTSQFFLGSYGLTFSNPSSSSTPRISLTASLAGVIPNSLIGTCLGGSRVSTVAVCGNPTGITTPQLNSIQLTFDTNVRLVSLTGSLRINKSNDPGATPRTVTSTWAQGASSEAFSYSITADDPANINPAANVQYSLYSSTFSTPFDVAANQPITVSSSFNGALDYWLNTITVEVPAPLPLLGAGSAFAWSRQLRKRIKQRSSTAPHSAN